MRFDVLCTILDLNYQRIGREVMSENNCECSSKDTVRVAWIVVGGIITLACVLGFTAISVAFVLNAPW